MAARKKHQDNVPERRDARLRRPVATAKQRVAEFLFPLHHGHDILRRCGVELGKRDFLGTPVSL
jgi:hypothetical protein